MILIENLSKSFTLHNQGGAVIPVMAGASLSVAPGECVGLTGQSGAGRLPAHRPQPRPVASYTAPGR